MRSFPVWFRGISKPGTFAKRSPGSERKSDTAFLQPFRNRKPSAFRRGKEKMKSSIKLRAPAKLNLFFEVLDKRPDGYHNVLTVTTPISLCDDLTIGILRGGGRGVRLACVDEAGRDLSAVIPTDDRNLAVKGALALAEESAVTMPISIRLVKRIPSEAGLGGGSSDAAAVIAGLNRLWGLNYSPKRLAEIGARVGSDVPLFFENGFALGSGRGEVTAPIEGVPPFAVVIVKPPFGLSTAAVYRAAGETPPEKRETPDRLIEALRAGNAAFVPLLFNRFEETARRLSPELDRLFAELAPFGTFRLTGSGTALYAPAADPSQAAGLKERIEKTGVSGKVFVCTTIASPLSPLSVYDILSE